MARKKGKQRYTRPPILPADEEGSSETIADLLRELHATQYPQSHDVPLLVSASDALKNKVLEVRRNGRLHDLIGRYVKQLASRLSNHFSTITEIQAVAGARNDALSTSSGCEILWEFFGTASRVEEDLRKLERDQNPMRLKVAVVLDADLDPKLHEEFIRRVQGSQVRYVTFFDLVLANRFADTTRRIAIWLEELRSPAGASHLQVVDFDLVPGLERWEKIEALPFGYDGLKGHKPFEPLQDPVFFVDMLNKGSLEARIGEAFINVRFRQHKFHGLTEGHLLVPACSIEPPLNNGDEGYRSVRLEPPVLVRAGHHVRLNIRLKDCGYPSRKRTPRSSKLIRHLLERDFGYGYRRPHAQTTKEYRYPRSARR
jgi:hypothetical protein